MKIVTSRKSQVTSYKLQGTRYEVQGTSEKWKVKSGKCRAEERSDIRHKNLTMGD